MTAYTTEMTGTPIGYSETTYPYFFNDTDADGTLSEEEAAFNNALATGQLAFPRPPTTWVSRRIPAFMPTAENTSFSCCTIRPGT